MAGETFIKGYTLVLSVWDGSAAYRPLACLTSSNLGVSVDAEEVETMCDPGNVVKEYGSSSYSASIEGIYIDTTSVGGETTRASHDYLLGLAANKTTRTYRLATGLADTPFYYFTGLITSLDLNGDASSNATFSATIEVSGGYATVDPEA